MVGGRRVARMREEGEHAVVADFLRALGVRWFHCPNGGHRHRAVAAQLKRAGVMPGVPDFIVTTPPPNYPDAVAVAIELKARGGRVTAAQREWLEGLAADGWYTCVAIGAGDAISKLKACGYTVGGKR